jgi:hypothetical protein
MSNVTRFDDEADNPQVHRCTFRGPSSSTSCGTASTPFCNGRNSRVVPTRGLIARAASGTCHALTPEDHEIDFANFADVIRSFRRMNYEVPIRTINPEPAGLIARKFSPER